MQIHPIGEPLPPPNVCFLCEAKTPREDQPWINTMRFFEERSLTRLDGRKLVCPDCGENIAELLGWIRPDVARDLQASLQGLQLENAELAEKAFALEDFKRLAIALVTAEGISEDEAVAMAESVPPEETGGV